MALLPSRATKATYEAMSRLTQVEISPIEQPCLLLLTSGSTGKAKVTILSRENLLAASQLANDYLATPSLGWVCALPPDHIGGFLPVFRSLASGRQPVSCLDQGGSFDPKRFAAVTQEVVQPAAVSLVWRQIQKIADGGKLFELSRFTAVLVGGGPPDPLTQNLAGECGVNLIATYGMTESSGGIVWQGHPLDPTRIEIDAAVGQIGVISIIGPTVGWGYLDGAKFENGRFVTNDLGFIDLSGRLQVVGRNDDVVIVNGYNVSIGAIETAIREMQGVEDVAAVALDRGTGTQLFVATSPAGDSAPDTAQVRAFLSVALGRGAHPAEVINMNELPRTSSGKVDRETLKGIFET